MTGIGSNELAVTVKIIGINQRVIGYPIEIFRGNAVGADLLLNGCNFNSEIVGTCFMSPLKSFTELVHGEFCINCPIVLAAFQIQVASYHIGRGGFGNIISVLLQTEILHDFQQFVLFCAVVGKAPDYIAPIFKIHHRTVIRFAFFR